MVSDALINNHLWPIDWTNQPSSNERNMSSFMAQKRDFFL